MSTGVMQDHARCEDSTAHTAMRRHLKGGGAAQGRQDGWAQHHEVHACQAPRLCACRCSTITLAVESGLPKKHVDHGTGIEQERKSVL